MFGINLFGKRPSGGEKKELYEKSEAAAWAETLNPLRGLTIDYAARIYDNARIGAYADLQWLYNEIEGADPTLFTCSERRSTALLETDTTIRKVDAEKARGFDESLADDQAAFLKLAFADAERGNLNEALEHLGLAFFRGFSHARPLYAPGMASLEGFDTLDGWNFCRDIHDGSWWWNPDAASVPSTNCQPIPTGELVTVVRARHVDYPALEIYIRRALGDKKYGIFLERYGVPPVIIVMPPDTDKGSEPEYKSAAEKVAKGGSGTVPNGATVNYATEARGTNPFSEFLRRQEELIVRMATGGVLTTLSSPTGIGGGATDAHEATWRTIIRRDCKLITTPINRVVVADLLNANFPGRPHLAYFDFADPKPTAMEVFETASKAITAGYRVRQADLEEKSGYALEVNPAASGLPSAAPETGLKPSLADQITADPAENKAEPIAKPLQIAPVASAASAPGDGASEQPPPENAKKTASTAKRTDPVAEALKALESGADTEAALDAFDRAAKEALAPEAVAERAEPIAQELEAAAAAGKEGK